MNLLSAFTGILISECNNAQEYKIFGTQRNHIESIVRVDDEGGVLMFEVTTWDEFSTNSRKTKKMSLVETMDVLGRLIAARSVNASAEFILSENNE